MKTKFPNWLVIFALVGLTMSVELCWAEVVRVDNTAAATIANVMAQKTIIRLNRPTDNTDKVALAGVKVPLMPNAERLTFDSRNFVIYRVDATAKEIAAYYKTAMAGQGWRKINNPRLAQNTSIDKVGITMSENPISKKTEVAYAYMPSAEKIKVLGLELAQADIPTPPDMPQAPQMPTPPQMPDIPSYNGLMPLQNAPTDGQNKSNNKFIQIQSGPNGQTGPSEEDMQKMEEQRFQGMKQGLNQFANGVKMVRKSLERTKKAVAKCGVNMPVELDNALASADELIVKINSAKTADELDEIITDVQDVGSVLQEWGPQMGDLQRLCQMMKAADKEMKALDKSVKKAVAKAASNKTVDVGDLVKNFQTDVEGLRTTLAEVKELAKTDQETALDKLETDFFDNLDNVHNNEGAIAMMYGLSKGLKNSDQELKMYQNKINALKKQKKDTAEAEALLAALKTDVSDLKAMLKTKTDSEELSAKVEETFQVREDLQDELQSLGSDVYTMPKLNIPNSYNVNPNLPQDFIKPAGENADAPGGQTEPIAPNSLLPAGNSLPN